jgi:dihydropteroate synthase
MGILNVTPDSFSDGGEFADAESAVRHGLQLAADGADLLDIGGESTRPGSKGVADDEQLRRIIPVIAGLRSRGLAIPISIDTRSAKVANAALDAGGDIINDISAAVHDAGIIGLVASRGVPIVLMHMQGTPETMQVSPQYDDVAREVREFLERRGTALISAGVREDRIIVDPGIGFGKTTAHNLELLRRIDELRGRWPILVGPSRKRFIGELLGQSSPQDRLTGTAAIVMHCALSGVDIVRVHDVGLMRRIVASCNCL